MDRRTNYSNYSLLKCINNRDRINKFVLFCCVVVFQTVHHPNSLIALFGDFKVLRRQSVYLDSILASQTRGRGRRWGANQSTFFDPVTAGSQSQNIYFILFYFFIRDCFPKLCTCLPGSHV